MDVQVVREHAEAHCASLLAGEIDKAVEDFSAELHSNLGTIIAMLPLPLSEATVESVELGGKSVVAVLRLVGESQTVLLETRWKERDGRPTIVEASHVVEAAPESPAPAEEPAD
jgi:hypothetical protein